MKRKISWIDWWQDSRLLTLLSSLLALPVALTQLPPLNDLMGHLGRYHIQLNLATTPALQTYWSFKWGLVGNLGVDLLILPLAPLVGLERAVWIIALLLPPLMAWGIIRVARAVHGQVTPHALFALPFAAAFPFQFGFVNFWLAMMLALHALASWISMTRRRVPAMQQALAFLPVGLTIWLCHLYGWAVFAIMAGCVSLLAYWSRNPRDWPKMTWELFKRLWPMLVPAILVLLWQQSSPGEVVTTGFFRWGRKAQDITMVLRDQNIWLDIGSVLIVGIVLAIGVISSRFRLDPTMGLITMVFLVLQIILPIQLQGSAYADTRLWPLTFIVALLAIGPTPDIGTTSRPHLAPGMAAIAAALLLARIMAGSIGYAAYDQAYDSHLKALTQVEDGKKLVALVGLNCPDSWRKSRIEHLPSVAIARRNLFTNTQWAISGGQLLSPRYAQGTGWDRDPSQFVGHWLDCHLPMGDRIAQRYKQVPKELFDYLWVLDVDTATLPPLPGARPLYRDDRTALYRLDP